MPVGRLSGKVVGLLPCPHSVIEIREWEIVSRSHADRARPRPSSATEAWRRKVRLLRLADLDGRTKARRAADAMLADLLNDLGGPDHVSTVKRALAEHASILAAMSEHSAARFLAGEAIDVAEYATLTNSLRRLLCDVGLERLSKDITPDLATYLQGEAAYEATRLHARGTRG